MFQVNDLIFYGSAGVCRVEAVGHPPESYPVSSDRLYYKLSPLYENGEIFTPVDTKVFMRPVLSRMEAEALIRRIPGISADEFTSNKRMEMMDHFRGMLNSHSCDQLVSLIKTLYLRSLRNLHQGRSVSGMEQDFKKRAEGLLYGELAVALDSSVEEVTERIGGRIESEEQLAQEA